MARGVSPDAALLRRSFPQRPAGSAFTARVAFPHPPILPAHHLTYCAESARVACMASRSAHTEASSITASSLRGVRLGRAPQVGVCDAPLAHSPPPARPLLHCLSSTSCSEVPPSSPLVGSASTPSLPSHQNTPCPAWGHPQTPRTQAREPPLPLDDQPLPLDPHAVGAQPLLGQQLLQLVLSQAGLQPVRLQHGFQPEHLRERGRTNCSGGGGLCASMG